MKIRTVIFTRVIYLSFAIIFMCSCATMESAESKQVTLYNTQDEMLDTNTICERISEVYTSYDIFMHLPEARRKAGHVALKEAAYSKGGNAVVLTTQIAVFAKIEDEVKGIAFKCTK